MVSCDQTLGLEFLERDLGPLWEDENVPALISHDDYAADTSKRWLGC